MKSALKSPGSSKKKLAIVTLIGLAGLGVFLIYSPSNDGDSSPEENPSTRVLNLEAGSEGHSSRQEHDQIDVKVGASKEEWEERIRNAPSGEKGKLFHQYVSTFGPQLDFGGVLELLNSLVGPRKSRDAYVGTLFTLAPQTLSEKVTFFLDLPPESKKAALDAFSNLAYGNETILDFSGLSELDAARLSQADFGGSGERLS